MFMFMTIMTIILLLIILFLLKDRSMSNFNPCKVNVDLKSIFKDLAKMVISKPGETDPPDKK